MTIIATLDDIFTPGRISIIPASPPECDMRGSDRPVDPRGSAKPSRGGMPACGEDKSMGRLADCDAIPSTQINLTITIRLAVPTRTTSEEISRAVSTTVTPNPVGGDIRYRDSGQACTASPSKGRNVERILDFHIAEQDGSDGITHEIQSEYNSKYETTTSKGRSDSLFDSKLSPIHAEHEKLALRSLLEDDCSTLGPTDEDVRLSHTPLDTTREITGEYGGAFFEI